LGNLGWKNKKIPWEGRKFLTLGSLWGHFGRIIPKRIVNNLKGKRMYVALEDHLRVVSF